MNAVTHILLLSLALTGWAAADLPKKAPITKYTGLWTNSPFTSKPPPPAPPDAVDPLSDYCLAGVSPVAGGYRVTLLNKKKPEERITVDPDNPKGDFKILEVTRKSGDPLGTTVRISSGAVTGTVSFDEKLLVLAAPPAVKTAPKPPTAGAPGAPGAPPMPGNPAVREPRPRVIPPAPGGASANPTAPPSSPRPIHRGGR